jgi:hypothetical protein
MNKLENFYYTGTGAKPDFSVIYDDAKPLDQKTTVKLADSIYLGTLPFIGSLSGILRVATVIAIFARSVFSKQYKESLGRNFEKILVHNLAIGCMEIFPFGGFIYYRHNLDKVINLSKNLRKNFKRKLLEGQLIGLESVVESKFYYGGISSVSKDRESTEYRFINGECIAFKGLDDLDFEGMNQ